MTVPGERDLSGYLAHDIEVLRRRMAIEAAAASEPGSRGRMIANTGDSVGDQVARHIAMSGDTERLRTLLRTLRDPKQREIIMEALFESLPAVERLAWLDEGGIPKGVREKLGLDDADA